MSKRSNKRIARDAAKAVKKMSPLQQFILFVVIVAVIVVAVYGYYQGWFDKFLNPITGNETPIVAEGEVSVHFPELGNDKTGDCIYIKVGDVDILVDAGSYYDSVDDIENYVDQYCTDNTLEFVIVTHAHEDHYAGFAGKGNYPSLFTKYVCETIIDFPMWNKEIKDTFKSYIEQRDLEVQQGAKHYTALECYNNENGAQRVYNLNEEGTIQLEILYSYYYEHKASSENDYSVCFLIRHGSNNYLFTGDLEERGEIAMVDYYNEHHGGLPQCTLYKAGHHGSKTSSSVELLEQIKPQYAVVTTVAGTDEYTTVISNQFPTQTFINNIAPYTDKVYVTSMVADNADGYTSMNGDVVFNCTDGEITVSCSNNNTVLKDTDWFKMYRFTPVEWGSVS